MFEEQLTTAIENFNKLAMKEKESLRTKTVSPSIENAINLIIAKYKVMLYFHLRGGNSHLVYPEYLPFFSPQSVFSEWKTYPMNMLAPHIIEGLFKANVIVYAPELFYRLTQTNENKFAALVVPHLEKARQDVREDFELTLKMSAGKNNAGESKSESCSTPSSTAKGSSITTDPNDTHQKTNSAIENKLNQGASSKAGGTTQPPSSLFVSAPPDKSVQNTKSLVKREDKDDESETNLMELN